MDENQLFDAGASILQLIDWCCQFRYFSPFETCIWIINASFCYKIVLLHCIISYFNRNISKTDEDQLSATGKKFEYLKQLGDGQWLWHGLQSDRFQHQRTRVRIQPSAIYKDDLLTVEMGQNFFVVSAPFISFNNFNVLYVLP